MSARRSGLRCEETFALPIRYSLFAIRSRARARWGDLRGVTARIDHLANTGVDVVWLTPFFVSPMRDHGYDIADYRRVDPSFGGDDALDELMREAHARGLRVIGDLVVNHTSDQNPWILA